jgi:hypothetical protein
MIRGTCLRYLIGIVVTFTAVAAETSVAPLGYALVPVQLSMGRKVPASTKPASVAAAREQNKRFEEALNRLSPKERKQIAKAMKRLSPEGRAQLAEALKRQLLEKGTPPHVVRR